jgi:hypothetical protein
MSTRRNGSAHDASHPSTPLRTRPGLTVLNTQTARKRCIAAWTSVITTPALNSHPSARSSLMQTQPSPFGDHTDLLASLQTVQATVQAQTARFHQQLGLVKSLAARTQDGARIEVLGNVSLRLHRVHTLLFGGAIPTPAEASAGASAGADESVQAAFAEFSSLLSATQGAAEEVDALLAQTEGQLAQLQAVEA